MEIKHLNIEHMKEYISWTYADSFYNFQEQYKDSVLEEMQRDYENNFGLFQGEELIGIYEYHMKDSKMELGVAMNPKYIDQGHGRDFMVRCMKFAREYYHFEGCFILDVASHNAKAIHLYEALGFRLVSTKEAMSFNHPVTFLVYQKDRLENIIFDNGNVLTTFSPDMMIDYYFTSDHQLIKEVVFSKVWNDLDQGIISEEDAMKYFKAHLPERLHPQLVEMFAHWHIHLHPKEEMYQLMIENQGKFHYFLLSNAPIRHEVFKYNIPALKMMEGEVVSYRLQINKPDPRIYRELLDTYHIDPAHTLMIDDKLENIEEAIHQGMYGFVYSNNIEELKKYIAYLEV